MGLIRVLVGTMLIGGAVSPSAALAQSPMVAEVESVETGPTPRSTRMGILSDGTHIRMNMTNNRGELMSMIRGADPEVLMVSHAQRVVMRIPVAPPTTTPAVTTTTEPAPARPGPGPCRYQSWRRTGNTDTIGGFAAREVQVLDGTRVCATFWTSSAAPFGLFEVYERIGTVLTAAPGGPSPLTPMFARARALSRFPRDPVVRMSTEGSAKVTTLLRAAVSPAPAASDFEAPAGYTVRSMPVLGPRGIPTGLMPRVRVPPGKSSRAVRH